MKEYPDSSHHLLHLCYDIFMEPQVEKSQDDLKELISRHRELLAGLEAAQKDLEGSDLAKENAALKKDIEKLREELQQISDKAALLENENASYRNALYEQIYNEKVKIVDTTAQKTDIYFRSAIAGELNRLERLEYDVISRVNYYRNVLAMYNIDTANQVYTKLDEISFLTDKAVTEARANAAQTPGAFSAEEQKILEDLRNEQLTDEQIREVTRKNNFERFIGLNVLNAAGILILIVGAITLALFAYFRLPDVMKGLLIFILGGTMLAAGEFLNRKKPTVFSIGISSGGIGILYTAMVMSYMTLGILDRLPTVVICVLITAGAFVLSNRYNAQIIAAFALVGGYLPIFAVGSGDFFAADPVFVYGAMVYFVVLNLFALLISFHKKWSATMFIGLFLNILGTWTISYNFPVPESVAGRAPLILYVLFAFLIYTLIPVISTYRTKAGFRPSDIFLLTINTIFSCLILFWVFSLFGMEEWHGLLAVIFAAIYLIFGRVIKLLFNEGKSHVSALFYLTGLAFVVLAVPLQLGYEWVSLGWLAEGVLLAVYGILKGERNFRIAGFVISALCLLAFISVDLPDSGDVLFPWKYFAVTAGSVVILSAYMYKKLMAGGFVRVYKYFVLANIWFFTLYLFVDVVQDALYNNYAIRASAFHPDYLTFAALTAITFFYAYMVQRIKMFAETGTRVLSVILYFAGILMLIGINFIYTPVISVYFSPETDSPGDTLAGIGVLAAIGILSVIAIRDVMRTIVEGRRISVEWYPLVISGYSLILLTQILLTQFEISFSNAAISIIYVLTALAWIIYGFSRRFSFIRKYGLGLAVFSVVKLFLIDLSNLTQGYQIISYFALGGTLIAISYVYQYFSKRLELKEGPQDPG